MIYLNKTFILLILIISLALFTDNTFLYGFEIDNFERAEVQKAKTRLLEYEREFLERSFRNFNTYKDIVLRQIKKAGLPDILVYLPIIESGYSPRAHSRAGAVGLWQLMPLTAHDYKLRIDYWVDERKDPVKSTEVALKYLMRLFKYYQNWELALAAYNSGPGFINLAIKKGRSRDYWVLRKRGVLSRETSWYIPRFYAVVNIAENPGKYNINIETGGNDNFSYRYINLEKSVSLMDLCKKAGVSYKEVRFLNPELRRDITPPGRKYQLRVPAESFGSFLSAYHRIRKEFIKNVAIYTVRSGDTIGEIAESFQTSIYLIKLVNGLRSSRIYAGQELFIPVKDEELASRVSSYNNKLKDYSEIYTNNIRYKIQRGDTLWEIAERFQVDLEVLLALNGIEYDETIRPGDEILVPVSSLLSP